MKKKSKTVWIVACGCAGVARNPEFDNEADAIKRAQEEMNIPSYVGSGRRHARVYKVRTITKEIPVPKTETPPP